MDAGWQMEIGLAKEHLAWVLDELFNLNQERNGFSSIEETVVVGESYRELACVITTRLEG